MDALIIILEKDQASLYEYVLKVKNDFMQAPVKDIASPRSVKDLQKYSDSSSIYKPKCPIAVRGALLFNHYTKANKEIPPIRSGDKVKYAYLKVPNTIRENVISFHSHDALPEILGLHKYLDYEKQWATVFLSPLKGITDAIGWQPEKRASLEDFFS